MSDILPSADLSGPARPGPLMRCVLRACLPATVFFAASLAILTAAGFSPLEVLRDLTQQTGQSSFLGFLSSIGTWLWVSAAAICLFSARLHKHVASAPQQRLLQLLGWFSLVLAVDDFFLIHDRYIAEGILLPAYAIFILAVARRYWSTIGAIDRPAFVMTGALLAGSIIVDVVQEMLPISYAATQIAEEGLKFVGAAAWMYFCARIAAHGLARTPDHRS